MTASAVSHRSVQGSNGFAEEKRGPSIHSRLLTVFEVSEILQVPRSWVYAHVRPGCSNPLPLIKLGKYLRFSGDDIQSYLDRMRSDDGA